MKKYVFILLVLFSISSFSQTFIEGFIFDKKTNESLPYATIKIIIDINYYTITNEDGMFEVYDKFANDSIEVRFLGFIPKKVPISYFKKSSKLYLTPKVNQLNEVIIVAHKNKNYTYDLLSSLIQKYRNKNLITESKAFLSVTSSARTIPIEHIEGFYNSNQSLSDGIKALKIKSGRFGQNKLFPFYSLNNTDILNDFHFFKTSKQILPIYPGNLSAGAIKGKYFVKIDACNSCSNGDVLISFIPKKTNGRFFSGKILFNEQTLTVKKIELEINNPIVNGLSSIIESDIITPKKINLNINFNPLDFEKIQHIDFTFIMDYKSEKSKEIIKSHSFLYFYDYHNPFDEPYFTNNISFNNDYDNITALQATEDFWKANYQFPKSYNEKRFKDFFEKYGYLINYENTIPSDDLKYTKPSVILWNKDKRLEWNSIKQDFTTIKKGSNPKSRNFGANMKADKIYHSIADINKANPFSDNYKKFNFSFLLDQYKNENEEKKFITRTIFDRNSSYFRNERTNKKLVYINLIFDIYEYYRQNLDTQINNKMTYGEVKKMCNEKFEEASSTVEKMKEETNSGLNFQELYKWNSKIKDKLGVNNYLLIMNQE